MKPGLAARQGFANRLAFVLQAIVHVKSKYLLDDTLKGLQIDVDTEQGIVRLTGSVQDAAAKEHATQIAQGVEGVVNVDNQLTVQ